MTLLRWRGLRHTWPGAPQPVLDLPDGELAAGQRVFLHGPSGCGKSTWLALMAGVLLPSEGAVELQGRAWSSLKPAARDAWRAEHVGYLFQQFNLLPYLGVLDNVLLPARFSPARAARCRGGPEAHARALLQRVGLDAAWWAQPARLLSVGQQQRVAAARALLGTPPLVLADEPTSALDAPLRETFMDLLLGACQEAGAALVFVSHDERLAARFDTRWSLPDLNRAAGVAAGGAA